MLRGVGRADRGNASPSGGEGPPFPSRSRSGPGIFSHIVLAFAVLVAAAPALAAEVPVPGNYGDAMRWYERAAERGSAQAQFYLGLMLENGVRGEPDAKAAAGWYLKAADQGHVEAQSRIAEMYYAGRGVAPAPIEALRWFAAAAEGGWPSAQYNLALMYERGIGAAADASRAVRWYERAVESGIDAARRQLSYLHAVGGPGLEPDPIRALMWLDIAAEAGLEGESEYRDGLTARLSAADLAEAGALGEERLERLQGSAPAPR
ncbi:MAG: tetratricopeptide repeat protein [Rhodospirillales bacterium]|nr:tetratricopeptide repeat protein [Rhodospirillales bacterium]